MRLSDDRRSLEIRPSILYRIPPIVQIQLDPSAIKDLAGNAGSGPPISTRFLTTLAHDLRGPRLLGTFPDPGETDVPTNAVPQLLFDRTLNSDMGPRGGIVVEARGASVPFQASTEGGRVVFLGGVTLLPNTLYRVRVTTELLDQDGIAADQPASFEFTTGAGPLPNPTEATIVGPAYGGAPVATNTRPTIRSARRLPSFAPLLFSKLVSPRSGGFPILNLAASAELLSDRRTVVITPRDGLPAYSDIGIETSALADVTGASFPSGIFFRTSGDRDDDPPRIAGTAPEDAASAVPVTSTMRVVLSEIAGLMTPPDALRVVRNGERLPGQLKIDGAVLEFRPSSLDPDSDYTREIDGVADLAGNVMPPRSIRFHTAADSTPPGEYPRVVDSSLDDGDPGASDPVELTFNQAVGAGQIQATVFIPVNQTSGLSANYDHPVRVESAASIIRIVPLSTWPYGRTLALQVAGQDSWGRQINYFANFRARRPDDDTRPEVISIVPASGTPISDGQTIRLNFSKPMLTASESGLVLQQRNYIVSSKFFWSGDRRSVTVLPFLVNAEEGHLLDPLGVVASSSLVDLAGNSLKAVTAVFPIASRRGVGPRLRSIVTSWPPRGSSLDPRAPIVLALSDPVDPALLNRSLWVMTLTAGRMPGLWQVSADGLLARLVAGRRRSSAVATRTGRRPDLRVLLGNAVTHRTRPAHCTHQLDRQPSGQRGHRDRVQRGPSQRPRSGRARDRADSSWPVRWTVPAGAMRRIRTAPAGTPPDASAALDSWLAAPAGNPAGRTIGRATDSHYGGGAAA